MLTPLSRFPEQTYALMRIVAGFLFFFHGAQKIFGAFGGNAQPLASLPGAAGVIEITCGLLVMIGFWGGLAAFIASGEMAVAYFLRHQPSALWPIQNRGELAVLYCFVFLFIAARGSGIWSVDGAVMRMR
ncbi:MAG TPA: DoxX family protein [Vicinamibacterales bacterium]|nr:DoxX family protein [Vicinamibacterales bacterium]